MRRRTLKLVAGALILVWVLLLIAAVMRPAKASEIIRVPYHEHLPVPRPIVPADVYCWQTEDAAFAFRFKNFTPAHLLERDLLVGMPVKDTESLWCGGIVNGRFVVWPAKQRWVDRGEPRGRGTGHR